MRQLRPGIGRYPVWAANCRAVIMVWASLQLAVRSEGVSSRTSIASTVGWHGVPGGVGQSSWRCRSWFLVQKGAVGGLVGQGMGLVSPGVVLVRQLHDSVGLVCRETARSVR